jgi:uracil-DNA glycosylase family 4
MSILSGVGVIYDPRAHSAECDRCPLNQKKPVGFQPSRDPKHPKLIVIGMNPDRLEENRGIAFIGPAGRMLTRALEEAGFDRADAYVTNSALCRNDEDSELKRAIPCCAPRLANELAGFDKSIPILTLGAEAMRPTLGKAGITKARGFVWTAPEVKASQVKNVERVLDKRIAAGKDREKIEAARDSVAIMRARRAFNGRTIFPTLRPAFILRGADGHLPLLRLDIKRAVRWALEGPFPLDDQGPFKTAQTAKAAKALLSKMSDTVVIDIETDGADPMTCSMTCVGVCDVKDPKRIAILDPWKNSFAGVLRDALKKRTVVTQNGPQFDEIVLRRYGIVYRKREDTLVAHHAFISHLPKSLAHIGSVYTNASPWKQRFKDTNEKGVAGFGVKKEDLAAYNAADVRITALSWRRMQNDLAPERRVYELDMRMAELYQRMQITGILVDQERRRALSRKMKFRAAALLGEMRELLGRRNFHPAKPNDIRKALFGQLKAPTYLAPPTPTGLPSTAAAVLETLKGGHNRAATLADLIIRWRSANDVRSEYLDNVQVLIDGRVHAGWRLGPETGRPACRNPNLLNTPKMAFCPGCGAMLIDGMAHKETCKPRKRKDPQPEDQIRDVYIAAPGCVLVYFDTSQVEMRFSAFLSDDENFMKSCEGDVHRGNALVVFAGVPGATEALTNDPKGAGKQYRDLAKNIGFAISYLAEADKLFSHLIEHGFDVDMDTCQDIIDRIRSTYSRYFDFVQENVELCRRTGFLRTAFLGRKRFLGFHPKPTTVANYPIQAGVADVMAERLLSIDARRPPKARQLLYAYDSATYEVPEDDAEAMQRLIQDVWEEEVFVPTTGKSFKQPIELKIGRRLSDFG